MTKNRHELPRKKPGRDKQEEIAEDLPTLEPVADELPTLEPIADELPTLQAVDAPAPAVDKGPVKVAFAAATEANFDTVVTLEIAAMDKKAVPDAVQAALPGKATAASAQLRHRRVVVRCAGEAVVGTAAKDAIAAILKPHAPLLLVIRRGFGDESVHQGKLPEVVVTTAEQGGVTKVEVATGELAAIDLPIALEPHCKKLFAAVTGKRVTFVFTGKAKPDGALRAQLTKDLQAAGARRLAIGERVLFDQDLAERVRCTVAGEVLKVAVTPADEGATTQEALAMVLPEHAAVCKGKQVRIELPKADAAARTGCVEWAKKHGASRIEVLVAGAEAEVVWPLLVTLVAGNEVTLRLLPHGRSRLAVLAALRAEAPTHVAVTKGKLVVVDWPAGTALDGDAEAATREIAGVLQPKTLVCTLGGEQREPFLPEPVSCTAHEGQFTLRIDSEAGKPLELQRAVDRRLPGHCKAFRGKSVRVQVVGAAAMSRTLLRSVSGAIEAAGAMRLEVEEGGAVDVLLPPMLTIAKGAGDAVTIRAMVDGRDAVQQVKAMQREIDAAALSPSSSVTVAPSAASEAVAVAVMRKGAAKVVLDGTAPVQIHPPLFGAAEKKGNNVRVPVQAGNDPTMVGRQLDRELPGLLGSLGALATTTVTLAWPGADAQSAACVALVGALVTKKAAKVVLERAPGSSEQLHPVVPKPTAPPVAVSAAVPLAAPLVPDSTLVALLGRRDEAVPPMVVLGIAAGADAAHVAAVEAALQAHAPRFRGRSVLLVLRNGGLDVPVRKTDAMVAMLGRVVSATAAATLVFRGPDAQGRPHFQVLHSTLRALPVGAAFGDPRART